MIRNTGFFDGILLSISWKHRVDLLRRGRWSGLRRKKYLSPEERLNAVLDAIENNDNALVEKLENEAASANDDDYFLLVASVRDGALT